MIIAKNDEDKRSRVWNYVTGITTVLIIIVAVYFIYQGFGSCNLHFLRAGGL